METVEISVITQNNWWVARQVQRTYRLERLFNQFSALFFHLFCYCIGNYHVDVYLTFRGRLLLKSRAGG